MQQEQDTLQQHPTLAAPYLPVRLPHTTHSAFRQRAEQAKPGNSGISFLLKFKGSSGKYSQVRSDMAKLCLLKHEALKGKKS